MPAYEGGNVSWNLSKGYKGIQSLLFRTLVAIPAQVELGEYGDVQKKLRVVLREEIYEAPAQINRTGKSGYWDYPIESIDGSAILKFVRFFDWEEVAQMDNRFVEASIETSPAHPETCEKRVLVDWMYVKFDIVS